MSLFILHDTTLSTFEITVLVNIIVTVHLIYSVVYCFCLFFLHVTF